MTFRLFSFSLFGFAFVVRNRLPECVTVQPYQGAYLGALQN
jgi:hypothetical protein